MLNFKFSILCMVATSVILSACGTSQSNPSDRGRSICLKESRQAGTPSQAGRAYTECLQTIDERLAGEDHSAAAPINAQRSQEDKPMASASERYQHCFFNKEKIQQAHSEQFGLQGPAAILINKYGRDDPRARDAVVKQQKAYRKLEELIPKHMRDGLPLIPDSVEIFSRCDRSDFFAE